MNSNNYPLLLVPLSLPLFLSFSLSLFLSIHKCTIIYIINIMTNSKVPLERILKLGFVSGNIIQDYLAHLSFLRPFTCGLILGTILNRHALIGSQKIDFKQLKMEITIFFIEDTSLYVARPLLQLFHIKFSVSIFFFLSESTNITVDLITTQQPTISIRTDDTSLPSLPEFLSHRRKEQKNTEKLSFSIHNC